MPAEHAKAPWAPRFKNTKRIVIYVHTHTHTHVHTVFYMRFWCLDKTECLLTTRLRVKVGVA